MVFPSVPVYLDPPNWQQQPNQQPPGAGAGGGNDNNINSQLPPFPPPHGGVGSSSIRPGSMADRARLAKLPQPEPCLKCPRCDSTNTKFCYFNNYSLSQPRHFCKTCRRYWTRGGALRNVPVGGGCRRNKKSKNQTSSSASKSPVSSERKMGITCSNSSPINTTAIPSDMMGHFHTHGAQFPFMNPLQNLSQFGVGNLGLNFSGIQGNMGGSSSGNGGQADMGFQMGSHSNMNTAILSVGGTQQFPLFEPQTHSGLFPFQGEGVEESLHRSVNLSSRVSQFASVKMEDNKNNNNNHHALTSSRTFLGGASSESNQYWGGAGSNNPTWTDLSGLNSNSTSHLL